MIPRELFTKIRRLEVRTRGLVTDLFGGAYHSAFKGRGIAFAEVRPYFPGDDVRTIDWNVSARTGETHVKVYEEEREQTLMLAVDVSASEAFGTAGRTKRELAAELCAVLAFAAVRNHDKAGLLLFSDRVERFVAPRHGSRHALRLVRDLFAHAPEGAGTRLAAALEHLLHVLRRRAIVVVVSDWFDDGFERPLRVLASRHDVVAVVLRDPREGALPDAGLVAVRDAESGRTARLDTRSAAARERYAASAAERLRQTEAVLRRVGVDAIEIRTDGDWIDPLAAFFRRRNKRR